MLFILALLLIQAAPPPAVGATAPPTPPPILPIWLSRPTGADVAAAFPRAAKDGNIEGRATLRCTATEGGTLTDCTVKETPPELGFGAAALSLASKYQLKITDQRGLPVARRQVKQTVRFLLPTPLPPVPEGANIIANPKWLRRPDADTLARLYPSKAFRTELEGRAVLQCVASDQGLLEHCEVLLEAPVDLGFGESALKLATRFSMAPADGDGNPVAGRPVRLTLRFLIPDLDPG